MHGRLECLNSLPHGERAEAWQGAADGVGQLRTASPGAQRWAGADLLRLACLLAGSMAAPSSKGQPETQKTNIHNHTKA